MAKAEKTEKPKRIRRAKVIAETTPEPAAEVITERLRKREKRDLMRKLAEDATNE